MFCHVLFGAPVSVSLITGNSRLKQSLRLHERWHQAALWRCAAPLMFSSSSYCVWRILCLCQSWRRSRSSRDAPVLNKAKSPDIITGWLQKYNTVCAYWMQNTADMICHEGVQSWFLWKTQHIYRNHTIILLYHHQCLHVILIFPLWFTGQEKIHQMIIPRYFADTQILHITILMYHDICV